MSIVREENVQTSVSWAVRNKTSTMRSHRQILVAVEIVDENRKIIGIKRFVTPSNYKIVHLVKELRSKMGISPANTCHLLLKSTQKPMMMSQSIKKLHRTHKDESGFVFLSCVKQGVFGCCPNYKSPQHNVNPFEALGFTPPPLDMAWLLDGVAMGAFDVMDEDFIEDQSPWDLALPSVTDQDHDHNYVANSADPALGISVSILHNATANQTLNFPNPPPVGTVLQNLVQNLSQLQNLLPEAIMMGSAPIMNLVTNAVTNLNLTPADAAMANQLQNMLSTLGGAPVPQNQPQAAPAASADADQLQNFQAGNIDSILLSPLLLALAASSQDPDDGAPSQNPHQTDSQALTSIPQSSAQNHVDHNYA